MEFSWKRIGVQRPNLVRATFCYFSFFSHSNRIHSIHFNHINWRKCRCTWDSNPGPQDCRCRRIDWAMASARNLIILSALSISLSTLRISLLLLLSSLLLLLLKLLLLLLLSFLLLLLLFSFLYFCGRSEVCFLFKKQNRKRSKNVWERERDREWWKCKKFEQDEGQAHVDATKHFLCYI